MIAQMNYLAAEELRKLFRGGKLKALLLLSFVIGVLFVFIGDRLGLGDNLPLMAIELLAVVLPFFMVALGSDLMIGESKGMIKHALKLPVGREFLFIGKLLAGWAAGALIVLCMFVPAYIGGIIVHGASAASSLGAGIAELGGAILFGGLLLVLANSVSLWAGSSGVGLAVSVVLWMGMSAVGFLEPQLNRFFVTSYADWLQPLLYGGDADRTVSTLLFMIAYYIIGTILGLLAFQRKEL
ncbi:ABC transporter permease [Cohnella thailandensis]|uniref:ABC transporter permease n=1 Tax=Cohnella thailandensis TaxID=557557 RepID=A0A841SSB3_9BACL|nr:ABC transporter permease subunit [Cohnella thailandensis]MBB6633098.1 ABC transporter permease [Cohnella thailandensis]MBP1975207.1 ABC-type transport system involved in multi-copper enzyme maturation permease subunit [Cohnella thailandensis]